MLRFHRNVFKNIGRDLIQFDDWKTWLEAIQSAEQILNNEINQINTLASRNNLHNLLKIAKSRQVAMQQTMDLMQEQLDVSQKLLSAIESQNDHQMTAEELRCLQSFRLTSGGGKYEWYKERVPDRVEGTCLWLLQHSNLTRWVKQYSGPLLISADPGVGYQSLPNI